MTIHALLHHQPPGLACTGQQQQYHPVILTCRDARLPKEVLLRVERARVVGAVGRAALAPRRRHVALNVTRCDHPHSSDSVAKSSVLGFQFYRAGRVPGIVNFGPFHYQILFPSIFWHFPGFCKKTVCSARLLYLAVRKYQNGNLERKIWVFFQKMEWFFWFFSKLAT